MQVAIALFPRNTALDFVGPYEVLQRVPSIDVVFVGHTRGEVRTDNGMLGLICDATFDEVTDPDVLLVPGGVGTRDADDATRRCWSGCARCTAHTLFTTSVCTGSLVLAAAGLLDGLTATTHWARRGSAGPLGRDATPPQRVVEHLPQRIITAAGVSSGIDMALRLVELLVDRQAAAGQPADDRVRPAAAVRLRRAGQGLGGHPAAGAGVLQPARLISLIRPRCL